MKTINFLVLLMNTTFCMVIYAKCDHCQRNFDFNFCRLPYKHIKFGLNTATDSIVLRHLFNFSKNSLNAEGKFQCKMYVYVHLYVF